MSLARIQRELLFADMDTFSTVVTEEMNATDLEFVLAPYLNCLSQRERDAVSLVIMNRFSYAQAAHWMGVRRSAVFEYIRRAKEKWGRLSQHDRFDPRSLWNAGG